jgi:uncharacterized protein
MRKVVSNTTPIISLLKVGKLDLLKELYIELYIPYEVYCEIEAGKHKEYYVDLMQYEWIHIVKIQNEKSLLFFLDLDKGEAEAIVLANEIDADLIILDETLGRFHANHIGLKVTGTIGILLKAKENKIIDKIKPLLEELAQKGIWLSENLIKQTLTKAHEN